MAQTIQYQSTLPALIQQMVGTKATQSTGGSTSTTTGSANIDPLMQVFDAALAAGQFSGADMQNLIQTIFQEGAQAVPQLTSQYANATGSRVSNNSGLQLALGDLNKQMTSTAAKAVLDNRNTNNQIASGAAGNIAQATRGQTTTTGPATTTTNQGANPAAGLLTTGAGFLLNQADKRGWLDGIKLNGPGSAAANSGNLLQAGPTTGDFTRMDRAAGFQETATPQFTDLPSMGVAAPSGNGDFGFGSGGGMNVAADLGGSGGSFGAEGGGFGQNFIDVGTDSSNWGVDNWTGGWDTSNVGNDIDWGDFSGESWFANGGRPRMMSPTTRPRGYADGGTVKTPAKENIFTRRTAAIDAGATAGAAGSDVNAAFQARLKGVLTPAPAPATEPPKREITEIRFADGGVVRNRNNMGSRAMSAPTAGAINYRQRPEDIASGGGDSLASSNAGGGTGISSDFMGNLASAGGQMQGASSNASAATASARRGGPSVPGPTPDQEGIEGTTGIVGSPAENEAAVNGFAGMLAAGMLGLPGAVVSLGQKALGMPAKSMNPISIIANLLTSAMSGSQQSIDSPVAGSIAVSGPQGMMSSTPAMSDPLGMKGMAPNMSYAPVQDLMQALTVAPPAAGVGSDNIGANDFEGGGLEGQQSTMGPAGPMSTNPSFMGQSMMDSLFGGGSGSPGGSIGSTGIDSGLGRGGEDGADRGGINGGDTGGTGGTEGTSGSGGSEGNGHGGEGGNGGWKDGGRVKGPGTGTSDSIRVKSREPGGSDIFYSDDEFVIPSDVVKLTGSSPWQALINAFHTPVAR